MGMFHRWVWPAVLLMGVSGISMAQLRTIDGEVTYRAGIALPETAKVRVTIEDVSRADASSRTLATRDIETQGRQVPIPFSLEVPAPEEDERGRYAIRAQIWVEGRLAWTTTRAYQLKLDGTDERQTLWLEQVGRTGVSEVEAFSWRLDELYGEAVIREGARGVPGIRFDRENKGIFASAGLNSMGGTYTLTGFNFKVGPMRSTMMAGPPEIMRQEQQLSKALMEATKAKVFGNRLVLYAGDAIVAKFTAS